MYKHILVPTDGSALAGKAVAHGIALAKATGARITGITVTEPFHVFAVDPEMLTDTPARYAAHARAFAEKTLAGLTQAAQAAGVPSQTVIVEHEHPYQAIIDVAAAQGCDLIVMGSHGRRGVSAIVLGSQTVKLLTHSKTPVLVYRD